MKIASTKVRRIDLSDKNLKKTNLLRLIFFFSVILSALFLAVSIPRITVPLAFSYVLYLITIPIYEKLIDAKMPRFNCKYINNYDFCFHIGFAFI